MKRTPGILIPLALASCGSPAPDPADMAGSDAGAGASNLTAANTADPDTSNSANAARETVAEKPFSPTSAQGAADVVQTYYALLESGNYAAAFKLWSNDGKPSGMSEADFAASFDRYADYHATVGIPGESEGAAGSAYIEVPVEVYGTLKSGEPFRMKGPVQLRRVNDVPGATQDQRRWHISDIGVRPRP